MSLPPIPDLDPALYRWQDDPTYPPGGALIRLANGTEAWVGIKSENAKGQYSFYLATRLRLHRGGRSLGHWGTEFEYAVTQVNRSEAACAARWEDGRAYILYHAEPNEPPGGCYSSKVGRMVDVKTGKMGALGLRDELVGEMREGESLTGLNVKVYLVADVGDDLADELEEGSTIEVLTHFNHFFWDGISARMFLGEVLVRLGETHEIDAAKMYDGDSRRRAADTWEEKDLSEPLLDACKIDVEALKDDEEFKKDRDEFIRVLMRSGTSWGLPVTNGEGIPRTEWYRFTKDQSEAIIRAVKTKIGTQYTISHLGHAAMVLALLKTRPLPAGDTTTELITPLPVNGRPYLRDGLAKGNFSEDRNAKVQYGTCQAGAVVEFQHLAQWTVDESDKTAVKAKLEALARHIKSSYDYWTSKPYLLPLGVSKDNFLASFLSSVPKTVSTSSVPIFVSDGVVDRYVPGDVKYSHENPLPPGRQASCNSCKDWDDWDGDVLLTVEDCRFLLDTYNDSLLIRMESFKGATSLSFCFNDGYFRPEDAKRFLEDMAGFMLAFAD
ncbi:15-O-acetyltransferase Tri3-domain-containing protein [Coniochaeta sp. 2T2.1]|nr:15-O-acetyltransferase Tri3-domain-containing protein [Coniochaeta sp. 2T2.1]